ncbi:Zinc finger CCCH domain-containing protein 46 [Linum perenne]
MDGYEATRVVFSRIQSIDTENASKIMGLLLIQDQGEKEMIRLAFGPETLLHSVVLQAKKEMGLSSPASSASPVLLSRQTSSLNPASLPFYSNKASSDLVDDFHLHDQLSFLNETSSGYLSPAKRSDLLYPQPSPNSLPSPTSSSSSSSYLDWGGGGSFNHRRSFSVSDVLGSEDPNSTGIGWRSCHYFARGFCKNGSNCRFVHGGGFGDGSDNASLVGSPDGKIDMMMEQSHEILRSKRLAAAAALMNGEDMHKFGRARLDRNDLVNPASRQIYLTFPADSTFREEDVSNYFSIYGLVEDVRIPYQQKRMFGFVTFAYPETVKLILAKGNPHFVCDARVLVKPYKEKGKVLDKKQYQHHQQVDGVEFSPCGTPTGLDAREAFNHPLGIRMSCNTQDMLWRRKLEEQAELQQAFELQSRRFMNLQLLDVNKHQNHHHNHQRALSTGSPIPSPTHYPQSPNLFSHPAAASFPLRSSMKFPPPLSPSQDNCSSSSSLPAISVVPQERQQLTSIDDSGKESNGHVGNGSGKENSHYGNNDLLQESFEHILPDSPFASPTKDTEEYFSSPAAAAAAADASSLDMTSFKPFNYQMPRFLSGHGGIVVGMHGGTGVPTCPVGI